jgi:hypothetical protein
LDAEGLAGLGLKRTAGGSLMSLDPKELQDLLDELKASRISLASPAVRNIGVEGRLVRDGFRKALANRRKVIEDLVKAIGKYRKSGGDHQAIHALNKALERAELLLP